MSISKTGIISTSTFSETFVNPFDTTFYEEPDKSVWIRIIHHNNPASVLFASTNAFDNPVNIDDDRWWYASLVNKITNNTYEFMVKQKALATDNETKYRWIQTKNPFNAVFGDVDAADVTKITTSGYSTHANYGGIYKFNNKTYFVANNGTSGNWWGAFGSWTAFNGGIPGFAQVIIKTGYMDLYLRVDNQVNNITSIFKNSIISPEFIEF
jgi:hypothetical protein